MFEPTDFNRDAELRDFFKFLIKIAFFFLSQLDMSLDLYIFAPVVKDDFFSF